MYMERIGRHPDRLKNLYFTFLFVVRAVAKARPVLERLEYATGNPADDARTAALVRRLLDVEIPEVVRGFDESAMFKVRSEELVAECPPVLHGLGDLHELQRRYASALERKSELRIAMRDKFQNVSRIMDCVGCEKCRLWGKLQFLGLGTAMKILFADADETLAAAAAAGGGVTTAVTRTTDSASPGGGGGGGGGELQHIELSRNELVALVNVLHRLSMSLAAVRLMEERVALDGMARALGAIVAALALGGAGIYACAKAAGRSKALREDRELGVAGSPMNGVGKGGDRDSASSRGRGGGGGGGGAAEGNGRAAASRGDGVNGNNNSSQQEEDASAPGSGVRVRRRKA
jgi:ERO1-like protein alpha